MPRVFPPIEGRQDSTQNISPSLVHGVAGFTAGFVSTLAVHPFDVVKTRLQVDQSAKSRLGDSLRIVRNIVKNEGSYQGLYRGLTPNIIGNSISWGIYFLCYENIKDLIRDRPSRAPGLGEDLTYGENFTGAAMAGVLTAACTNPIWVVKTRMLSTGKDAPGAYQSISHGTRELWRHEGIRGFYRGFVPSLFGVSHGAIQFMAYERIKVDLERRRGSRANFTNFDYLWSSAVAKVIAGTITYPYQVVRSRLQFYNAGQTYSSARDVLKQIWAKEGLVGFYRGLGPNVVRVLPATCVTFVVYENIQFYLKNLKKDKSTTVKTTSKDK